MSIQIKGVDALLRKLGKVQGTQVLVKPMGRAVVRLQRRMQQYPPAIAGSKYRRTGTYGRRWTFKITASGDGVVGTVGNNTRYGPYVGSQRFQARVHRGRWNTDEQVVKQEQAAIVADFKAEIDRALEG